MRDCEKPRRPRSEEQAEITDRIARAIAAADQTLAQPTREPPLSVLVHELEEDEEAAMWERDVTETAFEREESERILRAEAEIEVDIPIRRARELQRTFARLRRRQAAISID